MTNSKHPRCVLCRRHSVTAACLRTVGGLNYQVEHHLFPTLPRHRLGAVAPRVAALCAQHGLAYEACGMAEGTRRVLACLAAVARLA